MTLIYLFTFILTAQSQVYFENLDEEIRYQEDPYYARYVKEKIRRQELERQAQIEQRKVTRAKKQAYEEARKQHVLQREFQQKQNELAQEKAYKKYQEKRQALKAQAERSRNLYVTRRNQKIQNLEAIRATELANMKRELSRLPANYFEAELPRVSKKKRRYR